MKIVIVGNGKMGRAVKTLAEARGHSITTVIGSGENAGGRAITRERLAGAQVAIEFTQPQAAPANLERLVEAGLPTVTGTTGWLADLPRITSLVERAGGALLYSSNFSAGVHLFLRAATDLARRFAARAEFDAFILEEHHAAKRDAPSGTSRALASALERGDPSRRYPITSVRAGAIPGVHIVTYDGPSESITLRHDARSRDGFAAGALAAAEWLPGHPGVHTFEEMLFGTPE